MPFVITEPCIGTKDRACAEVCPVDCLYDHPDPELNKKVGREPSSPGDFGMLVINPDECIHCGACESVCPVNAIFEDDDVPEKWAEYKELNARVTAGYSNKELDQYRVTARK